MSKVSYKLNQGQPCFINKLTFKHTLPSVYCITLYMPSCLHCLPQFYSMLLTSFTEEGKPQCICITLSWRVNVIICKTACYIPGVVKKGLFLYWSISFPLMFLTKCTQPACSLADTITLPWKIDFCRVLEDFPPLEKQCCGADARSLYPTSKQLFPAEKDEKISDCSSQEERQHSVSLDTDPSAIAKHEEGIWTCIFVL